MKVAARAKALLQLVADYRDQECRRLLGEAEAKARELLHQSYTRERAALHERITTERARARSLIQAAEAESATRERRRSEAGDAALIAAAWPRLTAALTACWAEPGCRGRWVESVLAQALARLPVGDWQVSHAPGWAPGWTAGGGDSEQARLIGAIERHTGRAPAVRADAAIAAGLRIGCGGALLDGTLAGLLEDRERIEARLLALWRGGLDSAAAAAASAVGTDNDDGEPS